MKIFLDGKLGEKGEAKISVFDHGFLYGDGIFEGIRAYNGRVFRLKEHLERLWSSAKAINLEIPMHKKEIEKALIKTILAN
ncbi:MAG: aminotransferase class IV, partial [Endomicrobium sp.]|nr:aminotransferase class IV [Endomicrobium sp.]